MAKLKQYLDELAANSLMIFERGILVITVKWALLLATLLFLFSRSSAFLVNILLSRNNYLELVATLSIFLLTSALKIIILVFAVKKNQAWLNLVERKRITIFVFYIILMASIFNLDLLNWLLFGPFGFLLYCATQLILAYLIAIFMNIDIVKEASLAKTASLTKSERKDQKKKRIIYSGFQLISIIVAVTGSYYLSNTFSSVYPIFIATILLIIGLVLAIKKQDKFFITVYIISLIPAVIILLITLFIIYLSLKAMFAN